MQQQVFACCEITPMIEEPNEIVPPGGTFDFLYYLSDILIKVILLGGSRLVGNGVIKHTEMPCSLRSHRGLKGEGG